MVSFFVVFNFFSILQQPSEWAIRLLHPGSHANARSAPLLSSGLVCAVASIDDVHSFSVSLYKWVSVDLTLPGAAPIRVFSSHLESVHLMGPISEGFRAKQARELLGLVQGAQRAGFSTIVMGDWNSQVGTEGDAAQILLQGSGLRDAWVASGSGDGLTFGHDSTLTQVRERRCPLCGSWC